MVDSSVVARAEMGHARQAIPKRIIQTAKSFSLSPLAKASKANLSLLHPDWDFEFFDDSDIAVFIAREFPQYRSVFEAFPRPIQRIDFFRYLAIYRLGGFYFDLDVFLWTNINVLTQFSGVFPFEELTLNRYLRNSHGMDWEIGNYEFGAAAGHPFLKKVIENCVRCQREPMWLKPIQDGAPLPFRSEFYVLNSTGPGLLSRTLAENPDLANGMQILFPDDVCDESTWHHFGKFGFHAMEGSWRDRGSYLRRRFGNIWLTRISRPMFEESRRHGKTRNLTSRLGRQDAASNRVEMSALATES